jgi:Putative phage abortive infection protein
MHTEPIPQNKPSTTSPLEFVAWACVILGFVAAVIGLFVTYWDKDGFTLLNMSSFGSYAQGAVASLWSLGALFFIYSSLVAQRQQIAQQERQLEEQQLQFKQDMEKRKLENEQQEVQFQSQQRAIQLQHFETSFFQLLQIFNQIVSDLKDYQVVGTSIKEKEVITYERRECFKLWHKLLSDNFTETTLDGIAKVKLPISVKDEQLINVSENNPAHLNKTPLPAPKTDERIVKLYFENFYEAKQAQLGHYYRILYHIVKLVDLSSVLMTYEDKRRYVSLLRAQLSAYELLLIFYNGISTKAVKFKPLMETYGIFEHLDEKLLLAKSHKGFYKMSAYK